MYTIGFANKYYTLWDCTTNERTDDRGIRYITYSNVYLKNISFDLDKAQKLYPGAPVDESLKGHTRSFNTNKVIYPDNVFHFGKYCGKRFDECSDYDYMAWYFQQVDKVQQEELIPILEDHGYFTFPYFDMKSYGIETAEEHAAREEHDRKLLKEREYVKEYISKGELILDITSNPNEEGEYYDMNSEYTFKFNEVRSNCYQGFEYYLPVMNGKCKRIKNKSIKITDGEIVDGNVLIHAFEVLKK